MVGMRYPFIGGRHDGQWLDVDQERIEVPYAEVGSTGDVTCGRELYQRERFALYVQTGGLVERCEWEAYLHGEAADAPPPWWVVIEHAPARRTMCEPLIDVDAWALPPAVPATTLFQMGASWL